MEENERGTCNDKRKTRKVNCQLPECPGNKYLFDFFLKDPEGSISYQALMNSHVYAGTERDSVCQ